MITLVEELTSISNNPNDGSNPFKTIEGVYEGIVRDLKHLAYQGDKVAYYSSMDFENPSIFMEAMDLLKSRNGGLVVEKEPDRSYGLGYLYTVRWP